MKHNSIRKWLSVLWCIVLIAALALNITGCAATTPSQDTSTQEAPIADDEAAATILGEGSKTFFFVAVDLEGKESKFEIHTDAETVGAALMEHQLLDGDPGDYGLYVKTVNGITLDWDKDAKYWSLLIDGEYAMTGVDQTEITEGSTYTFLPAE